MLPAQAVFLLLRRDPMHERAEGIPPVMAIVGSHLRSIEEGVLTQSLRGSAIGNPVAVQL